MTWHIFIFLVPTLQFHNSNSSKHCSSIYLIIGLTIAKNWIKLTSNLRNWDNPPWIKLVDRVYLCLAYCCDLRCSCSAAAVSLSSVLRSPALALCSSQWEAEEENGRCSLGGVAVVSFRRKGEMLGSLNKTGPFFLFFIPNSYSNV